MKFLRSFAVVLCKLTFSVLVIVLVPVTAVVLTLNNSSMIKAELKQSGVFKTITNSVVTNALNESAPNSSQRAIETAIFSGLDERFIDQTGDQVIDSFYAWLEGASAQPEFTIDIQEAKTVAANNYAQSLGNTLRGLPNCTAQQLRNLNPEISLTQLTCLPPGLDIASEQQKLIAQTISNPAIPNQISSSQLFEQTGTANPFQNLAAVPKAYQTLRPLLWGLAIAALVFSGLSILLHRNHWRGTRFVGWILIGGGAVTGLMTGILYTTVQTISFSDLDSTYRPIVSATISILRTSIINTYLIFTVAYLVLGTVLVLVAHQKLVVKEMDGQGRK